MTVRATLAAFVLALALVAGASASAVGNSYHWHRATTAPAVVTVVDNLPAVWHPFVLQAAADYSQALNLDVVVSGPKQCIKSSILSSDTTYPDSTGSAWLSGILGTNTACIDYHQLDALGGYWGYTFVQTTWTAENGWEIAGAEVFIDPQDELISPGLKQWLVCHELGHAMGLEHRPWGDVSCMVNGSDGRAEHQHPGVDDIAVIDKQTTVWVTPKPTCKRRCR